MIHFLVTTLYGYREPNYLPQVIKQLLHQAETAKVPFKITVAGRHNEKFDAYQNDKVEKVYLPGLEGIHVANKVNETIKALNDEDYYCLFHDDLFIDFDPWVRMFMEIYERPEFKCGVLGVLSHSQSAIKYSGHNLYQMTYTNGNFFAKAKNVRMGNDPLLDEECGDLDLCYEQMYNGRKNYLVGIPYRHYMVPYPITFRYLKDYKKDIGRCRAHLNKKWSALVPEGIWDKHI